MKVWLTESPGLNLCATDNERKDIDERLVRRGDTPYVWVEVTQDNADRNCARWWDLPPDISAIIAKEHMRARALDIDNDIITAFNRDDWDMVKYLHDTYPLDVEDLVGYSISEGEEDPQIFERLVALGYTLSSDDLWDAVDRLVVSGYPDGVDYTLPYSSSGALKYAKRNNLFPEEFGDIYADI